MTKFEIFYPVKPWKINQGFGVNGDYYKKFGIKGHNGLDAYAVHGQPVYAAHDGVVTYAGVDAGEGWGVVLRTDGEMSYVGGSAYFKSVYWHLINNIQVKAGQRVKAGQLLGYADSTGASSGDHLHFAIKPMLKGENEWTFENVVQNNGYNGAIDPTPYFNGYYAVDAQKVLNLLQTMLSLLQKAIPTFRR